MNHTEHTAKAPSPRTGPFATLRAHLRRAKGSGAPSTAPAGTSALPTAFDQGVDHLNHASHNTTAEHSEWPHARTRSGAHAALIQNPRSARRDHGLIIFARSCIAKRGSSGRAERPVATAKGQADLGKHQPSRLELRASRRAKAKDAANAMKRSYDSVRERIAFARTPGFALLGGALAIAFVALAAAPSAQAACPNEQLRLEANSTNLPDCRAYEVVSPPKEGDSGGVFNYEWFGASNAPVQAAPLTSPGEEDAITYTGQQFYRSLYGETNQYLSRRTPAGWSTANLTTPNPFTFLRVFSSDLSGYVNTTWSLPQGQNLELIEPPGTPPRPLITVTPPHRSPFEFGYVGERNYVLGGPPSQAGEFPLVSASADLSKVFFAADDSLLPETEEPGAELGADVVKEMAAEPQEVGDYMYESDAGHLSLISILPASEGGVVARHSTLGYEFDESTGSSSFPNLDHAVSTDGSRVFWTDLENGNLYVREGGTQTTLIASSGARFLSATPDGSRVFYARGAEDPNNGAGSAVDLSGGDLYEYDVASHETHDLSGGEVQGFLGASADGEYVYFVSPKVLTEETNARGEAPTEGAHNLFLSEPDPAHPAQHLIRFIATLSTYDDELNAENDNERIHPSDHGGDWAAAVYNRTAEVSPNGRYLAFDSNNPLTGVSNAGNPEIFLYSAPPGGGKGALACASCDPGGQPNEGAFLPNPLDDGYGAAARQRYVLDNGELFFNTTAALVQADVNNQFDVYDVPGRRTPPDLLRHRHWPLDLRRRHRHRL